MNAALETLVKRIGEEISAEASGGCGIFKADCDARNQRLSASKSGSVRTPRTAVLFIQGLQEIEWVNCECKLGISRVKKGVFMGARN